jgi:hypothetical protein
MMTIDKDNPGVESTESDSVLNTVHKKFWCNFCNFESDDLQDYLSHSCRAVLAERGESEPEQKNSACR